MKIGRNDPCPCGSGKKYKLCCGRSQPALPRSGVRNADAEIVSLLASAEQLYRAMQYARVAETCDRILALRPGHFEATLLLGRARMHLGDNERAIELFRAALKKSPNDIRALYFLGRTLGQSGRFIEAESILRKAIRLDPNFAEGYNMLGTVLHVMGRTDEAAELVRKAVELDRQNPPLHSHQLVTSHSSSRYSAADIFGFHQEWARRHANPIRPENTHANTPDPDRKIRLGYVSPNFSRNIVGYFFKPVFDSHDRNNFEIFCYSNTRVQDDFTGHFANSSNWRAVANMSDEELTRQIRRDAIDILVDLSGHTPGNRLLVFARKPAPVQVTWLDYFDTSGLETMDYLITDPVSTPPDGSQQFVEKIIRMPHMRLCWSPPDFAPDVSALPVLERGRLTFGSFNRPEKMTADVIGVWARILREVPDSRLILKNRNFVHADVQAHFRDAFGAEDIAPERVEMRTESPHAQVLREYGDVDIALDTFPYNGGATTCDALWMGVPVITLLGDRMISRQGASMLTAVGLTEFIADDRDRYVGIATQWSNQLNDLADLRGRLRGQCASSPLCDTRQFTSDLQSHYREMWRRWCTLNRATTGSA